MSTSALSQSAPPAPATGFLIGRLADWAAHHSITVLRVSIGLIFLTFGVPKFIPGASPVEALVTRTVDVLSLGLITGHFAMVVVAVLETFIALTLITGWLLRLGLAAMGGAMIGFFAPLVLFPDELFGGGLTLEAQYIIKDIVLITAAFVIATKRLGVRPVMIGH
jgi:putative oxidoreductase